MEILTKKQVGRPRSETTRQVILSAALTMATEQPYVSITMEGIAARAGVGKQTLYRWWQTTGAIVLEALTETASAYIIPTVTEDPPADLRAFLTATFRILNTPTGRAVRLVMAEAQRDAAFAEAFRERLILRRRAVLITILHRLASPEEGELLADFIFGAMWYRLLVGHAPLDDTFAEQIATGIAGMISGKKAEKGDAEAG